MIRAKYVSTHTGLLRALFRAKRSIHRIKVDGDTSPATVRSSHEDVSPFTLREGLFFEHAS